MATSAQIIANRENAQHSTGPKSAEGKARVSQNRITHGLAGRNLLLPGEDLTAFHSLLARYTLELVPGNAAESFLIESIAHAQWRLNRVVEWEAALMTESLTGDPSLPTRLLLMFSKSGEAGEALAKLLRYEAQLRRQHQNALKELRLQKSARHKANTVESATTIKDIQRIREKAKSIIKDLLGIDDSNPIFGPAKEAAQAPVPAASPLLTTQAGERPPAPPETAC